MRMIHYFFTYPVFLSQQVEGKEIREDRGEKLDPNILAKL